MTHDSSPTWPDAYVPSPDTRATAQSLVTWVRAATGLALTASVLSALGFVLGISSSLVLSSACAVLFVLCVLGTLRLRELSSALTSIDSTPTSFAVQRTFDAVRALFTLGYALTGIAVVSRLVSILMSV